MKKFFTLLLVAFIMFSCDKEDEEKQTVNAPNFVWEQIADFPGQERVKAATFAIDGYGYVGLGDEFSGDPFLDFYRYDPTNNTWQQLGDFPGDMRYSPVSFAIDGYGYVGFGSKGGGSKNDFWKYDPSNDTWTQMNYLGNVGGFAHSVVINSKGYVLFEKYDELFEYDPVSDTWTEKAELPQDNRGFACFALDGNLYAVSGYEYISFDNVRYHKEAYRYDPDTDKWEKISNFDGKAREDAVGFSVDNYGFVVAGIEYDDFGANSINDTWCYDADNNKWFKMNTIPQLNAPKDLESFVIGNTAYVGGGQVNSASIYSSSINRKYFKLSKK